jgi:predicted alpha/beta superfamily hydrolase
MGRAGPSGPYLLAHAESFDMTSGAGAAYRIGVGLPRSYGETDRAYPVLYVLDGDDHFPTMLDVALSRALVAEVAEVIIVGIGYPEGTEIAAGAMRRIHEFSSARWDTDSELFREFEAMMTLTGLRFSYGGADAELAFVVDELQPEIAARYRVDPADSALFGHSAGGNFVGYALFRRPGAFAKYIAASPSFCFNDWQVLRLEEEHAERHDDLPVTLYLAAGADEAQQYAQLPIASGTVLLAEALQRRRYPGLRLTCELLTGKRHHTAVTEIMQRGVELCWPGVPFEARSAHMERNLVDLDKMR